MRRFVNHSNPIAGDTTEKFDFPSTDPVIAFNALMIEAMTWIFPLSMMTPEFAEFMPGDFINFAK